MKLIALKTPAVVLVGGHHGRQWTAQDVDTGNVVRVTIVDRGGADDGEKETIEIDIEELELSK
jgi:hypothetical protein